ncbi:hypothetical protein CI610_00742 [invertebrate metagenome]|uniref:Uncharacterized protein n=1 Tax=invertebrate metagenome TaxID=1711999 RepID=A0A2H9TAI2_9ZZZZ
MNLSKIIRDYNSFFIKVGLVVFGTVFAPWLWAVNHYLTYSNAIMDAAVIEYEEILGVRPVLSLEQEVVVWMRLKKYQKLFANKPQVVLSDYLWVTLNPEVQNKCRRYLKHNPDGNLMLRLQQMLGLPPMEENRVFVVLKVRHNDLFRPCADPDITTTQCGAVSQRGIDEEHALFFTQQVEIAYQQNGYPWTRLGYTYDWHPNAGDYGASEYVIKKGATVKTVERVPSDLYCMGN